MYPVIELPEDMLPLEPLWKEGQKMFFTCYLSPFAKWKARHFISDDVTPIGEFHGLSFDWDVSNQREFQVNVSAEGPEESVHSRKKLWTKLRQNGTVYLHVHITHEGASPKPSSELYEPEKTIHKSMPLIKVLEHQVLSCSSTLRGQTGRMPPSCSDMFIHFSRMASE